MNDIVYYNSDYLERITRGSFKFEYNDLVLLNRWVDNVSFILEIDKRLTNLIEPEDLSAGDVLKKLFFI